MDENAIENLLISDWASGLRITTVPQAMSRLGFADDLETRWQIADRMDAVWHSALEAPGKVQEIISAIGWVSGEERSALPQHWRDQVVAWDRASILLTDNEKLMARLILWCRKHGSPAPSLEDIGAAVGIGPLETTGGITMLARLGFLALPNGPPADDYTLTDGHLRFLDGLGFSFHTVTLDGGERFGIP